MFLLWLIHCVRDSIISTKAAPGWLDQCILGTEVSHPVSWCSRHNLHLNTEKTKGVIRDFRRREGEKPPLEIPGNMRVFSFLGTIISENLYWESNVHKIVKLAHKRLYFCRSSGYFGVSREALVQFYTSSNVLTLSLSVWFGY